MHTKFLDYVSPSPQELSFTIWKCWNSLVLSASHGRSHHTVRPCTSCRSICKESCYWCECTLTILRSLSSLQVGVFLNQNLYSLSIERMHSTIIVVTAGTNICNLKLILAIWGYFWCILSVILQRTTLEPFELYILVNLTITWVW